MSVRRTVAQSSAGLLLLAAFAAGPAVTYAAPGASDGGGDEQPPPQTECEQGAPATASADTSSYATNGTVTITGTCFPARVPVKVDVITPDAVITIFDGLADGSGTVVSTFEPEPGVEYSATIKADRGEANVQFSVSAPEEPTEPTDPPETEEPTDPPTSEEPPETEEPAEPTPGDGDESDDSPTPGDDGEQGGDESGPGDDGQNSDDDEGAAGNGGDSDDEQAPGTGNDGESGPTGGSDEEQQGGDTTASGSPTKPSADYEEDGDTSASAAYDNAASKGNAPAQPPAAPGSATNDFPAAQQEATADQKQSAALAVLMTKLFAGGVSSGSVGTTPEQARTVINPSDDASEIEVPAGSDTGGSSDNGSGSETSDGDALAATGSNMLIPAGIAAAAILLGAGLKIHQLRRGL